MTAGGRSDRARDPRRLERTGDDPERYRGSPQAAPRGAVPAGRGLRARPRAQPGRDPGSRVARREA